MSVRGWYCVFLRISDDGLRKSVDLYNRGLLADNARKALELIEGLPLDD